MLLLRRQSTEDRLQCCSNDEKQFTVQRVDDKGFVTVVKCTNCRKHMETTCHDVSWTYEKIHDTSVLVKGDHICWHRPCAIWHHAIVSNVTEGKKEIIHYSSHLTVEETTMPEIEATGCCIGLREECNSLYRVNYQDCYSNEYTALRARKLAVLKEKRYDLLARNCEHFSRWCKTGSTSSSQVSIAWTSLGKMMLAICLKAVGLLVVLGLLQFAHESQEDEVKDRPRLEKLQNILLSIYIVVMTVVFVIYLLKTSCSRLGTVPLHDDSSGACSKLYNYFTRNRRAAIRLCCTLAFCCFNDEAHNSLSNSCRSRDSCTTQLFCSLLCCCHGVIRRLFCSVCRHVQCHPCSCCRRQGHLACGLFTRIFIR